MKILKNKSFKGILPMIIFFCAITIMSSISIFSTAYASEGDMWITPTNQNVDSSQNFDIDIYVDTGGKNIGAFNIYFNFNATDVTIDTTQGDNGLSAGTDTSSYTLSSNANDIANGSYRFAGITASNYANSSSAHIATIHAKTTSNFTSGTSSLSLTISELSDELGIALDTGTTTGAVITFAHETAVYRFFNTRLGNHFYTISETEKNDIIANLPVWNYEGIAYYAYLTQGFNTTPLYRFFNTETGFHFYTKSEVEKNDIIANLPVWNYEGIAYYIFDSAQSGTTAVYRFFNKIHGNHFYTISSTERDDIINNLSSTWNYEGIAFYVLN